MVVSEENLPGIGWVLTFNGVYCALLLGSKKRPISTIIVKSEAMVDARG